MRAATYILVVAAASGCGLDDPPDVPSWQVDVMPVLAANCVRCHGYPLNPLVPSDFRLDAYAPTQLPGLTTPLNGAGGENIARNLANVTDPDPAIVTSLTKRMPPNRVLGDREYRTLRNWSGAADAVSNQAPRGPGRPDNRSPSIAMEEVGRANGVITLAFEVRDLDHDLVSGNIIGPTLDIQNQVQPGPIGVVVSGRRTFAWDTANLPAGTYEITARLDDGADIDGPEGEEDYIEVPVMTVVLP